MEFAPSNFLAFGILLLFWIVSVVNFRHIWRGTGTIAQFRNTSYEAARKERDALLRSAPVAVVSAGLLLISSLYGMMIVSEAKVAPNPIDIRWKIYPLFFLLFLFVVSILLGVMAVYLKWPSIIIPPYLRDEPATTSQIMDMDPVGEI